MNTLDEWTRLVIEDLGVAPDGFDRDLLLDLTKDVAHGVARPAAPLTAYLIGLAAGRAGGGAEDIRSAVDRVRRLVSTWDAGEDAPA